MQFFLVVLSNTSLETLAIFLLQVLLNQRLEILSWEEEVFMILEPVKCLSVSNGIGFRAI